MHQLRCCLGVGHGLRVNQLTHKLNLESTSKREAAIDAYIVFRPPIFLSATFLLMSPWTSSWTSSVTEPKDLEQYAHRFGTEGLPACICQEATSTPLTVLQGSKGL